MKTRNARNRIRVALATYAVIAVSAFTTAGCSGAPEPGSPAREPSPLFEGYQSYRTLDDLKGQLGDRSTWQILGDEKSDPRPGCPRFDTLTFEVPARHLGQQGRLQLNFINNLLESTSFTPEDFPAYAEALQRTGVHLKGDEALAIAPATKVWQWDLEPRFVGWADTRFADQVHAWINRCS